MKEVVDLVLLKDEKINFNNARFIKSAPSVALRQH